MGILSIPVRLTLAETCAAALAEAADGLEHASDAGEFVTALDANYRLWLRLRDIAREQGWRRPAQRDADFVSLVTHDKRGAEDQYIESLITLDRDTAATLADGRDLAPIRDRAALAWRETGRSLGLMRQDWLIAEITRKGRLTRAYSA